MIMALMPTDLPLPVAPAIIKCGMRARSPMTAPPAVSLPSATARLEGDCTNASASMSSRSVTSSRFGFATSMPTTALPGTGARILTPGARIAIVRSSARLTIRLTFTPGAGSISKVVITGPG